VLFGPILATVGFADKTQAASGEPEGENRFIGSDNCGEEEHKTGFLQAQPTNCHAGNHQAENRVCKGTHAAPNGVGQRSA